MTLRCLALALTLLGGSAAAQDWAGAIAFVQAPEQAGGVGVANSIEEAIAAAVQDCIAGGGYEDDCVVTAACSPAGWSVDVFVQHQAGNHWHEHICGLPTEAAAQGVEALVCDADARPELIECAVVQIWTDAGTPTMEW